MSQLPDVPSRPLPARGGPDLFRWSLAAGLVLVALLVAPAGLGRIYTHDDLGAFHLPIRAFYADQLALGRLPDWMPQLFGGFYLTGEGQAGTYHPLHLLLYWRFPLAVAWMAELVMTYPLMLAGTFFFLRRRVPDRGAAMFGALAFTFGGFNLLHLVHPNAVAVVAHVPWLLWAIDVLLVGQAAGLPPAATEGAKGKPAACPTAIAWAGIALLTGSQLLLGYPQYVWFSLLAEAAYFGFVLTERRRGRRTAAGRAIAGLVTAKLVGLMLGAVQLLPTADALAHSARASAGAGFADWGSLHPLNLVQWIAPYLFVHRVAGQNTHELGLYVGAVPLVLVVWLVFCRGRLGVYRRAVWATGAFGLGALWMAAGRFGLVYRLQRLLPVVGGFRFPCRYSVLFSLALAVLAAMAVAALVRDVRRGRVTPWRRMVPLWIVAGASLLVALVGLARQADPFVAPPAAVLAGPFLLGTAAALVALAARGWRWAPAAMVLFAAADLGFYGLSYAAWPHTEQPKDFLARQNVPPGAPHDRVLVNLMGFDEPGLRCGDQMTLAGWHRADGYAGLEPARQLDYSQVAALRTAGVRWVRRGPRTDSVDGLVDRGRWMEVPEPLARFRLVTRARATDDPGEELSRSDVAGEALVRYPLTLPCGTSGLATPVEDRPGEIRVRTSCPTTQLLVVAESYHRGWQARVDGREQPVWRTNGDFLGCTVPPGEHDVELEFHPASLRAGKTVSCVGLALVIVLTLGRVVWPPRKKNEGE